MSKRTVIAMGYRQARAVMDTVVAIEVVEDGGAAAAACDRAFGWFAQVERACSRFEEDSEVTRLVRTVGVPVVVSPVLFEAVRFGVVLGAMTGGAFEIAIGGLMERRGFDRSYRTGTHHTFGDGLASTTYRDIQLDAAARTITLRRPMVLDLGAVAKGLAIDLAVRELARLRDFSVDAGGDIYAAGHGRRDRWRVGIQHPRTAAALSDTVGVTDAAVCTSGDYQRRDKRGDEHHIVDPRTGRSPAELASVTVVAANAMLADGLSTAAFVLGHRRGLALVERCGGQGMAMTRTLERHVTTGFDALLVAGHGT